MTRTEVQRRAAALASLDPTDADAASAASRTADRLVPDDVRPKLSGLLSDLEDAIDERDDDETRALAAEIDALLGDLSERRAHDDLASLSAGDDELEDLLEAIDVLRADSPARPTDADLAHYRDQAEAVLSQRVSDALASLLVDVACGAREEDA